MHQLNFVASSSNEPFLTVQFAATFCQFRYKVDRNTKQWFLLLLRKVVNSWRSMISDLPCLLLDKENKCINKQTIHHQPWNVQRSHAGTISAWNLEESTSFFSMISHYQTDDLLKTISLLFFCHDCFLFIATSANN